MATKEKEQQKESKRTFYGKIAVVGTSGSGKSYLMKTADPETTGIINSERKPYPFKMDKKFRYEGSPKSWAGFMKNLKDFAENPEIKYIIIDSQTMALDMLIREMGNAYSGYDIYKNYNKEVYNYLDYLKNIDKDVIVLSHDETALLEGYKQKYMASHGKEFGDGKMERHYVCVLYTGKDIKNGVPEYFLKTFEEDTTSKTPENMFPELHIPNDAKYIFDALSVYYS